jgi:prepilin-type N-terminal cleavage/methylation domain-containing protein
MARPRHAHRLASHTPLAGLSRRAAGAFTLVEILIVVVIIGILATVVIPQFTSASHQARENTLKDDLRYLRNQVQVYTAQHLDVAPGFPPGNPGGSPSSTYFISQMTQPTNASGATGAGGVPVRAVPVEGAGQPGERAGHDQGGHRCRHADARRLHRLDLQPADPADHREHRRQ